MTSVPPSFDLEAYIGRYPPGSETRLQRLLFIAEKTHDTDLSNQAFQMAERQMRDTSNTRRYKEVFGMASRGGVMYDEGWVEETDASTQSSLEVLEGRLSVAQAHLNKEAIRTAYLEIGTFARQRGDLQHSLRAVLRSRDYCTNRSQTTHVCLLVIELSMELHNYPQVHDYVSKAEHSTIPGDTSLPNKLRVASGLAHIGEGRFEHAAKVLTTVIRDDIGNFTCAEDVALYTVLCGIASLGRAELLRFLETQSSLLELVPAACDAMQRFCRADYQTCLAILQQLHPLLELDLQLAPHLASLMETILHRCLVEYLRPYRKVNLQQMSEAFRIPLDSLFSTLAELIRNGRIKNARLDARSHTLEKDPSMEVEERKRKIEKRMTILEDNIINNAYAMIIRMSCLENDQTVDRRQATYIDGVEDDVEAMDTDIVMPNPEDTY